VTGVPLDAAAREFAEATALSPNLFDLGPSVQKVISERAVACTECGGAAFFQARIEYPAGPEFIRRRANACSGHLIDIIQLLRSWARAQQIATGSWLTVLAIDPYALPRLAALGIADPGFAFYSAPITRFGAAGRHEEERNHV
jgi:hypothetical protein